MKKTFLLLAALMCSFSTAFAQAHAHEIEALPTVSASPNPVHKITADSLKKLVDSVKTLKLSLIKVGAKSDSSKESLKMLADSVKNLKQTLTKIGTDTSSSSNMIPIAALLIGLLIGYLVASNLNKKA